MKVLKDENNIVKCESCKVKLQYEKEDIQYGEYGFPYITCLNCSEKIDLSDKEEDLKITTENIEYPTHFYHFGTSKDSVKIEDTQINKWIKECLNDLKNGESENYSYRASGNSIVFVFKLKDEYEVFVCPNYYSGSIYVEDEK